MAEENPVIPLSPLPSRPTTTPLTSLPVHLIPNIVENPTSAHGDPDHPITPSTAGRIQLCQQTSSNTTPYQPKATTPGPVQSIPINPIPTPDVPVYSRTRSRAHIIPPDDDLSRPTVFATEAQTDLHTGEDVVSRPEKFFLSTNPFGPSTTISISVKGTHAALGLDLISHQDTDRILIESCAGSTPVSRISRW
eukprot:CAMPEP_0198259538 /NCGR_PEP_ID=MMETSP1447-20131203/8695_1 /TAXON_ID=420782 /ORGANISM="Chaetoceros dichaeta, Strain CCMP1751" /LENGTH=192 /DNA_ID=CAMNT_0043946949 /DNA_START=628 /DNA_END=1206 /DNA_ORIENTATION=-